MSRAKMPEFYQASNLSKNLATAGLTDTETAIVKCTYPDDSIPKEKHVITLLKLADFDTSFFLPLLRRIATREYRVVIKTLMVLHRITRDGPANSMRSLESRKQVFESLTRFQSSNSPVHARLIKLYSAYWLEKIHAYTTTSRSAERDSPSDAKSWAMKMNLNEVTALLPALQKQMDRLLQVDPGVPFLDPNIRYCFNLLFRDSMRLYNVCNILLYTNMEKVAQFTRPQAAIFLQCCYNSVSIDDRYQKWHGVLQKVKLTTESLPQFAKLPPTALSLLEAHLNQLDIQSGAQPGDGLRIIGADATISSTAAQNQGQNGQNQVQSQGQNQGQNQGQINNQQNHHQNARFHNDTMVGSSAPQQYQMQQSSPQVNYGGYSNQKPQPDAKPKDFTFDEWNDSEWNFDTVETTTTTNGNDPFGKAGTAPPAYQQAQQQQTQQQNFGTPSVQTNPQNSFNSTQSPSFQQSQTQNSFGSNFTGGYATNNQQQQQQPQQQPQPQQNSFNQQNSFHARHIAPVAQEPDPFDAFVDFVPQAQTSQIKTTKTGANNNPGNDNWNITQNPNPQPNRPTNTQAQINSMYGNSGSPTGSNTGYQTNTNLPNNGPSARSPAMNPPAYDDDPFGNLVMNNGGATYQQSYQQPANNHNNPYQQPTSINFNSQPSSMAPSSPNPYAGQQPYNNANNGQMMNNNNNNAQYQNQPPNNGFNNNNNNNNNGFNNNPGNYNNNNQGNNFW